MQNDKYWQETLAGIRVSIDQIDAEIIRLLGERGKLVHKVGELKPHVGAVRVPERERQVVERAAHLAAENGLDAEFGRDLYHFLLNYFATREEQQVLERTTKLETSAN
ncbi:MAG: Prephenate dehydratase [Chloroflexi bacterium]|nr:Prephenate dehydratase [Chloroflexota bacterium]